MNDKKQIRVLLREPGKEPEVRTITDSLENLQSLVSGRIETISLPGIKDVICILNEESKLEHLDANIFVPEYEDLFTGTMVAAGDSRSGEFRDITDAQIEKVKAYIAAHDAAGYEYGEDEFMNMRFYSDSGEDGEIPFYDMLFGGEDSGGTDDDEADGGDEM